MDWKNYFWNHHIVVFGENSVRRNFRRRKFRLAKFSFSEISFRRKFVSVKIPVTGGTSHLCIFSRPNGYYCILILWIGSLEDLVGTGTELNEFRLYRSCFTDFSSLLLSFQMVIILIFQMSVLTDVKGIPHFNTARGRILIDVMFVNWVPRFDTRYAQPWMRGRVLIDVMFVNWVPRFDTRYANAEGVWLQGIMDGVCIYIAPPLSCWIGA